MRAAVRLAEILLRKARVESEPAHAIEAERVLEPRSTTIRPNTRP